MIDEISFKILKILQEKARIPNVEVGPSGWYGAVRGIGANSKIGKPGIY